MAIYYLEVKIGSRGKGQSAVASAAYRSGTKLKDEEAGKTFNYSRKKGVVHSEISLCANAPQEYTDRETLWNAVHKIEKASNSRLFREILVAIPKELKREEQIQLVREYVKGLTDRGMCCDWNIHDNHDGNPHAHIMCTVRSITNQGKWAAKSKKEYVLDDNGNKIPLKNKDKSGRTQYKSYKVDYNNWNEKERVEEWRAEWSTCCNKYLSPENKIDHRSYKRQGVETIPQIHEGASARIRDRLGWGSDRCDYNRKVKQDNQKIQSINLQIQANEEEIKKLKSTADFDVQQLVTLRDEYVRQAYILDSTEHNHIQTEKQNKFENAQKCWEKFQECVRTVQKANYELEKMFIFMSKKKRQQKKDQAVKELQQAKQELQQYIRLPIGYEFWLRDFRCEHPDSDMEVLPTYIEKSLESLEKAACQEQEANQRLQEYMDMHVSQESVSNALRAFSEACQNVPVVYQREAAELLAKTKIPVHLDNCSYFPQNVRTVTEQISQILQRNQLILPTQADQPDETESPEIGQKKKHLQLQHHSDEQVEDISSSGFKRRKIICKFLSNFER